MKKHHGDSEQKALKASLCLTSCISVYSTARKTVACQYVDPLNSNIYARTLSLLLCLLLVYLFFIKVLHKMRDYVLHNKNTF